ncbi:MAG: methyltransferase domain-containing protein [Pseudomonadales bacterium]
MANFAPVQSHRRLASWLDSQAGRRTLAQEGPRLAEVARRFHGDTLLWLGCHQLVAETVRGCMVRHRFYASPDPIFEVPAGTVGMCCEPDALPARNNAFDAVVLHHALERARDPRTALREVARVLTPGGRLLICGFNPLSLLGGRVLYARLRRDDFSDLHSISVPRLRDWLALLQLEVDAPVRYLAYSLPFNTGSDSRAARALGSRLQRLQPGFGGVYVVSAVKQAMALRPRWRRAEAPEPRLAGAAYPTARTAGQSAALADSRAQVLPFDGRRDIARPR